MRLRVLTWHVHGSYLYYLSHVPHELYVPVREGRPPGYVGLPPGGFPWPENLHEIPAEQVPALELDAVLSQTHDQWLVERDRLLSPVQRRLPRLHVEHDPPREHPVDQRHPVDDPEALLVHVTHFNELMWDSGATPTRVVEHGVAVPEDVRWTGELDRGLVLVNDLPTRGRRLGADIYRRVRAEIPLDLVGMGSEDEPGGLGEVPHDELPEFAARYRFLFNPIRYTSLGLAVLEAMAVGLPVIGSDVAGIRQLLPHWLLFDPAAPASLLERCRVLFDDVAYRRAAAHGSSKVREFTADVLSPRRRALLAELRQLALAPLEPQRAAPALRPAAALSDYPG